MSNNGQVKEEKSLAEIIANFWIGTKRFWWLMMLLVLFCGALGYKIEKNNYVPQYNAVSTISITAPVYNGDRDISRTNDSELASELGVSFNYLINNDLFYEVIKSDLGVDRINGVITVSVLEDTNILTIGVTSPSAKDAYDILNSVMNNYSSIAQFVLGDTELTVLEEPVCPQTPINPFIWYKSVGFFSLIGFFISLIPIFLYGFFVKTVKSKKDIENMLNLKCFGELPGIIVPEEIDGKKVRYKKTPFYKKILFVISKKAKNAEMDRISGNHVILDKKVGFIYLEAVRKISSRYEKELKKKNYKVILVTSTIPGEGKSTVSMNLALSLSKTGNRVVLIDGDLRKPNLRKMIDCDGISYSMDDFINKRISIKDAFINIKDTRVVMIAADRPTHNPIENINSENMKVTIEQSKNVADYVIIDAPPCSNLADAAAFMKYADAAIYVIRDDYAKVNTIIDAIQELSYTRKPIIGTILNQSHGMIGIQGGYGRRYGYGYGGRYGYGKKYGYGYGYGKKYGYGYGYGYGEYGEINDREFSAKERTTTKNIKVK